MDDESFEVKTISIGEKLSSYSIPVKPVKPKIKYRYQELGLEMQKWFPQQEHGFMWSLFYRYHEDDIREAYRKIQFTNKHSVPYLIGIIKNLK